MCYEPDRKKKEKKKTYSFCLDPIRSTPLTWQWVHCWAEPVAPRARGGRGTGWDLRSPCTLWSYREGRCRCTRPAGEWCWGPSNVTWSLSLSGSRSCQNQKREVSYFRLKKQTRYLVQITRASRINTLHFCWRLNGASSQPLKLAGPQGCQIKTPYSWTPAFPQLHTGAPGRNRGQKKGIQDLEFHLCFEPP